MYRTGVEYLFVVTAAPIAAVVAVSAIAFIAGPAGYPADSLVTGKLVAGTIAAAVACVLLWGLRVPCRTPALARPGPALAGAVIAPALVYAMTVADPHRLAIGSIASSGVGVVFILCGWSVAAGLRYLKHDALLFTVVGCSYVGINVLASSVVIVYLFASIAGFGTLVAAAWWVYPGESAEDAEDAEAAERRGLLRRPKSPPRSQSTQDTLSLQIDL